ncbi:MAG: hypothetical protein HDT48_05785 [Ruminococcaceae bacterium]|nr:hypothetical protein [Oscillospiraceae bacterium]
MTTYELQPTQKNILNTFLNDSISRNSDVLYFIDLLSSLDNSCSISLDGAWGSGKTFFVKQVKMIIDACNHFVSFDSDIRTQIINRVSTYKIIQILKIKFVCTMMLGQMIMMMIRYYLWLMILYKA